MHRHVWMLFRENALAYFSKRNDLQTHDLFWLSGNVHHCVFCGEMELRPYVGGYGIIAVEMAEEPEEKFALQSLEAA